ncbi:TonB-dependent receptor [Marinihelvus fidelis]|uniref:TonB-dependent receptor n=1 Tax=Marinihelvus fidelis TaxID=2613842 RepID=A0A5N0TAJ4_9GAMM|nr:TonB-dependent receptor [Marinihelvus fidelis]KAA9132083.1 TonB-dependent receptor [Marinihelvus fidelis]
MNCYRRNTWSVLALAAFLLLPFAALAQETSSSLRVDTYSGEGTPVSGVNVTVTDTRTGTTRNNSTSGSGTVTFSGLRIGGPYTVVTSAEGFGSQTVTDVFLSLGDTYRLPLALSSTILEEVIVTATQVQTYDVALGPSSTFGLKDLEDSPHINRDIRDIVRFDPRVYQDNAFVGAMQCAGANPRFNSLTVDGVRMNDNFGLNSNGYPTERQPFPYDAIQEVAVELAPFDVQYGGFTACNVNAVTKSGENEFFGSVFFDYTNDSMRGDKLQGDSIDLGDFDEKRYGGTFGGPLIKDTLFFFVAYEKLEGANLFDRGPAGSGRAREVNGVSQAQYDEILDILQNVYGFDPGGLPLSLPNEDEKYTVKLDWNINDYHRASLTYNYNDGFNIAQSDGDSNELEFGKHYYERGAELNATSGALYSDWTDRFSTEVRVSYSELDNRQLSRSDSTFGEFQIETWNDPDGDGNYEQAIVYAGTDDSRQANVLSYETLNLKLAGAYAFDNHTLTFGYERDDLDMFNLFLQHVYTENRFDEECGPTDPNGCIEALREGRPDDIYYGNSRVTNDPRDSAAEWGYQINTLYAQDEMILMDGTLTLVAGLRYDWYTSDDLPTENPNFIDRAGYTNAMNLDGEDLLQPRVGFTWDIDGYWTVRGGFGLFGGGNPNVWLSNNYSTDGITQVQLREFQTIEPIYGVDFSLFDIPLGPNGSGQPGYDVPTAMIDAVANGTANTAVNALDPNFKIPASWKFALGATWDFHENYQLNMDLLYNKLQDSALLVCGTCEVSGTAPDGRPIYSDSRAFSSDYILTNVSGSDGESLSASVGLSASYDFGLDWSVGYAYTQAEEVNPMTSSVAFSNFANIAVDDFNMPSVATANYEIPHRFTFRVSYEAYWWGDNASRISLFGSANEGRPYSYTFAQDDGDTFGDFIDWRHLLYVPTGMDDPNVVFGPDFNTSAFFAFVEESGLSKYAGGIAERNAFNSSWWTTFDIRFEQEFPGFRDDHHFSGFVTIRNFCNMLNDDWCTLEEVSFPRSQGVVDMEIENGQYLYELFLPPGGESRAADASLYEIRVGLSYKF